MATLPWFVGPASAGIGWGDSTDITGAAIKVPTYYANSPSGFRPDPLGGVTPINTGTPLQKFVDGLPGIPGFTTYNAGAFYNPDGTNLNGQAMPLAKADTTSYPGCRYYTIGVVEYTSRMHTNLPKATTLRGYVQLETDVINNTVTPGISKHIALTYPNGSPILGQQGQQLYAVDQPNFLGPVIATTTGTPVRITYANLLPTGHFNAGDRFGDLFLPVDTTIMGAGTGPLGAGELYTQNRISIHHHGGDTPWISDGTPHQWTVPKGETTSYKTGDSFSLVSDMPDPGDGWGTLFFQNDISGRLMFYHDHALGLTRLNVFGGMAAGYLIFDKPALGENRLITAGVLPTEQIPLVIQEKTFVPQDVKALGGLNGTTPVGQDEKWDTAHWGQPGDLWFPHVYEFNQDPNSFDGTNPPGRWDYGPYFWPIFPASGALPTGEFGNVSTTPEAFGDTPLVNGTAYPVLNVDPKAYRFRILNASNDRMLNLGLYVAADNTTPTTFNATGAVMCDGVNPVPVSRCTEVKMVPFGANAVFPAYWGTPDNREGGVPDPATAGPDIIQIGTEGGFLPAANVIPSTPINFEYNKRSVTILNVLEHGLFLGNAERADAVIDFSQFAGKTLILYNDAPAPLPAGDPRIDYYTGNLDMSGSGGAYPTLPGYGPNTRTVMQIRVSTAAAVPFNATNLVNALPQAYADVQPKSVVAGPAYDAAFGTANSAINQYGRIFTGSINQPTFTFKTGDEVTYHPMIPNTLTIDTKMVTVPEGGTAAMPVYNKAIQELFDPHGRMNATLGVEIPFTGANIQTTVPLEYIDPATEVIADGETQIWKITHNGVDTHPVHFHLVNVQLLNRVGWDGTVKPPADNELGWKETVRMNPLEDVFVAVRAKAPKIPFGVPESVRPMAPAEPLHSTAAFSNLDPLTGNAYAVPVTNENTNFGWEYVWHCHILGHEENDFMRPLIFRFKSLVPHTVTGVNAVRNGANRIDVSWIDPTPITNPATYGDHSNEIGFIIERSDNGGPYLQIASTLANTTSFSDTNAPTGPTYLYTVRAYNAAGTSGLPIPDDIGAYRAGEWYMDVNNNGAWEPGTDFYGFFGTADMTPITGDWNGDGRKEIGAYRAGDWYLDLNGNGLWDGEPTDVLIASFGDATDIPVVGDWNGDGIASIGIYRPGTSTWYLDYDGNGAFQTAVDVTAPFGQVGDIPVVGDWDGSGTDDIGVYRNGRWELDFNGNYIWEGSPTDILVASFGVAGMLPVVGDWTGIGVDRIGAYRDGDWYLDIDGNGIWNPAIDRQMGPFGVAGMVPMIGSRN
jgi:FtsP/CotA-like multicopper oxidase with cupredoxin domain